MSDLSLDDLRSELADFAPEEKAAATYTPREERILAGFEDIMRFYEEHGRAPLHGEDRDIFERLYAVRLDRIRALEECRTLLAAFDKHKLLDAAPAAMEPENMGLDDLRAELAGSDDLDITKLRHVPSREERRAAEEIAGRERCEDFEVFEPLFQQVQRDLDAQVRTTRPFVRDAGFQKADIQQGDFFIVGGQIAYVESVGDPIKAPNGETDARLRVIYSNGTESDLLLRSLQRALYKDDAGRRITEPEAGPLFSTAEPSSRVFASEAEDGEVANGCIYVLRSQSEHPFVAEHREVIHKIGVTGGSVEARIAGADKSATYLLAGVEVAATYKVFNVNPRQLEALIHKVFSPALLDLALEDRFGNPVRPREWFLVPISAINDAVERIRDGSIVGYRYDPASGRLTAAKS
ncbi:GIY-YIG nuclease family protein [Brevundimonas sp.]|uniref:GIY-YIG nuclease family protein n=1 Tax=Brevundimonas sp. TaxID=1871086 RepID=UPI0028988206|nr:GIY-YIG nuclease family protein [Brevundimonas sp.]